MRNRQAVVPLSSPLKPLYIPPSSTTRRKAIYLLANFDKVTRENLSVLDRVCAKEVGNVSGNENRGAISVDWLWCFTPVLEPHCRLALCLHILTCVLLRQLLCVSQCSVAFLQELLRRREVPVSLWW